MKTTYPKKITFEYDNKDIVLIGDGVKKYFDKNIINPISEAELKMETYNKNAKCPKCGNDNQEKIDIEHYPADYIFSSGEKYDEFLNLTCKGCGYEWEEKPLDAAAMERASDFHPSETTEGFIHDGVPPIDFRPSEELDENEENSIEHITDKDKLLYVLNEIGITFKISSHKTCDIFHFLDATSFNTKGEFIKNFSFKG